MRWQKFGPGSCIIPLMLILLPLNIFGYSESVDDPTLTEGSYTILVEPRKYDCYYVPTVEGVILNIYFKVIRGGDLLIDFRVVNPASRLENSIELRGEGYYTNALTKAGYYSACFNNHEFMATKVVVFTFETHPPEAPVDETIDLDADYNQFQGEADPLDIFNHTFHTVQSKIRQMFLQISFLKAYASYHKAGQDKVNFNVAFYSGLQSIVIFVAGIVNVIMIRKLFVLP